MGWLVSKLNHPSWRGIGIYVIISIWWQVKFCNAQVANDNIQSASRLHLNETFRSNTIDCSVQWDCVDETLTGKCIEYHNDQWFVFNSQSFTKLYLNLLNQRCRDQLGVQIVVIEGIPCDPASYRILDCISLANHQDIFVKLSELKPETNYLINIDGYLHDNCYFDIQLSQNPIGISANSEQGLEVTTKKEDHILHFNWKLPETLASTIFSFKLLRKRIFENKYKEVAQIALKYNAYGKVDENYYCTDTLTSPETYEYKLVVEQTNGEHHSMKDLKIPLTQKDLARFLQNNIQLRLDFKPESSVSIFIFDYFTHKLLQSNQINFDPSQHSWYTVDKLKFKTKGHRALIMKVINNDSKQEETYEINL